MDINDIHKLCAKNNTSIKLEFTDTGITISVYKHQDKVSKETVEFSAFGLTEEQIKNVIKRLD